MTRRIEGCFMARCKFKIRDPHSSSLSSLRRPFGNPPGFAYVALLAIIVIIGISLGAAGNYWQSVMARDREEELLFRGDQYRRAIERYYLAIPGKPLYPQNIDDLLTDNRTAVGRHFLRRKYNDPMTGGDFIEVRDPLSNRIIGVHSGSDKTPLKRANFADPYAEFAGKSKYSDWQFVSVITTSQQGGIAGPVTRPVAQPSP